VSAAYGAINQNKKITTVTILANDNPFGSIMFENHTSVHVDEGNGTSHVMLSLIRIGGTVGDVEVRYRYTLMFLFYHLCVGDVKTTNVPGSNLI